VAGLAFTLGLPDTWRVALLTKGGLGESNTRYAQGGISAAIGVDDSPLLHEADTIAAGAGLCDVAAVRQLVDGAPGAVTWLLEIGTKFDRSRQTGDLLLGREAAHSRHRVLHAGGDATGAEIERSMVEATRATPGVHVFEYAFAIDLLVEDGRCTGLLADLRSPSSRARFNTPYVVLAAGGAGQLWSVTSNPRGATADGLAMALRAGVAVADLEFVQFHPTVLAVPGTEPFLVTEAVRGEGAYLLNGSGERFMIDVHPLAELAPRDVVTRGIQSAMTFDGMENVFLDLRHLDPEKMHERFPTIARELRRRGLDLTGDLIPVAPAAHYFIGGIVAGTDGSTSLPGLLALGEASCTGVHGANRLASNSLLEGLVFGLNAAATAAAEGPQHSEADPSPVVSSGDPTDGDAIEGVDGSEIDALVEVLQSVMSREVAVVRTGHGLERARFEIATIQERLRLASSGSRRSLETLNLAQAALAVVDAAAFRRESRGAHFRLDFDAPDPALEGQHSMLAGGEWKFGHLAEVLHSEQIRIGH
jgi:L-aspartate oxidase